MTEVYIHDEPYVRPADKTAFDNNLEPNSVLYDPGLDDLSEILVQMELRGTKNFMFESYHPILNNYKLNLDLLAYNPCIEYIPINFTVLENINFLYTLPNLKGLTVLGSYDDNLVFYDRLPCLEFLSTDNPDESIGACTKLITLRCYESKKIKKLAWMKNLTVLKDFILAKSKIKNLQGIENCKQLDKVFLAYCNGLTTLSPIGNCTSLTEISLENIKSLDISDLAYCQKLKTILCNVRSVPSVVALADLPVLEKVTLATTQIEDGNMAVLQHIPKLHYKKYEHYNL